MKMILQIFTLIAFCTSVTVLPITIVIANSNDNVYVIITNKFLRAKGKLFNLVTKLSEIQFLQ